MQTLEELQKRNGALEFQNHQLHEYLQNYIKFYYDMLEVSLTNSSFAINFDPNKMPEVSERIYRITESQYKTFQEWSRLVREFNQSNGVNRT